jgi:hypothetical protein
MRSSLSSRRCDTRRGDRPALRRPNEALVETGHARPLSNGHASCYMHTNMHAASIDSLRKEREMTTRNFALFLGIVYAIVGVLGFIPGITQPPPSGAPPVALDTGYGYLLGIFPINIVHNLIHLVVGLWGIAASRAFSTSRIYARTLAIVFGLLTIMGLIPGLDTVFGLVPIFGVDIWLHLLTAVAAAYFGWAAPAAVAEEERAVRR